MDDQRDDRESSGMLSLIRLIVFLLIGAWLGLEAFAVLFDQRDGIHLEYIAKQRLGLVVGAICGLLVELLWRGIAKAFSKLTT